MKAVTDEGSDAKIMSAGVKNLFTMLELLAETKTVQKFQKAFEAKTLKYSELKTELAEAIISYLKPIQARKKQLVKNKKKVIKILADGAKKARMIAQKNLLEIKKRMGLL